MPSCCQSLPTLPVWRRWIGVALSIEDVKEAYGVYGVYDIVAKVEAETIDRLKEVITSKVRRLRWVRSTLTMMVIE